MVLGSGSFTINTGANQVVNGYDQTSANLAQATWVAPIPPNTILPFSYSAPGSVGAPAYNQNLKVYVCPADNTVTAGYGNNQNVTNISGTTTPPFYYPWAACSYAANYQVFGGVNGFGAIFSAVSGVFAGSAGRGSTRGGSGMGCGAAW